MAHQPTDFQCLPCLQCYNGTVLQCYNAHNAHNAYNVTMLTILQCYNVYNLQMFTRLIKPLIFINFCRIIVHINGAIFSWCVNSFVILFLWLKKIPPNVELLDIQIHVSTGLLFEFILLNFGFKLIASNASWISVDGRQRGIGASEHAGDRQESMAAAISGSIQQIQQQPTEVMQLDGNRLDNSWGHHTQSLYNENMETYPVIAEAANGWSVIMQSATDKGDHCHGVKRKRNEGNWLKKLDLILMASAK